MEIQINLTEEMVDLISENGNYLMYNKSETKEEYVKKMINNYILDCIIKAKKSREYKIMNEKISTEMISIKEISI